MLTISLYNILQSRTTLNSQLRIKVNKMHANAKTIWSGGLKTESLIRGFEVETDQPKNLYGTNLAPAPAEVFAASLGACFVTSFVWYAWHKHLRLDEITADVKIDIETTNNIDKITEIKIKAKVWSEPKAKKQLEKCFEYAKTHCPLTKALNVPINTSIKYKLEKD
jgi:organic hydroperoxide reductase OsmC/OhrA